MYVNNLMLSKAELVTVTREDNVQTALDLIVKNDFLSLPVVDNHKFYGNVSKELIFEYYYKANVNGNNLVVLSDIKIKDVMGTDFPQVHMDDLVETAVNLLYINKSPFVTVVDDNGDFKGIITHKAIFKEFTEVFGINKGNRIAVTAYDIPGQILKLTKIISENKADIISCVVSDPKSKLSVKEIVLRVKTNDFDHIVKKIEASGFKVNL